jgi:hypothetical protein
MREPIAVPGVTRYGRISLAPDPELVLRPDWAHAGESHGIRSSPSSSRKSTAHSIDGAVDCSDPESQRALTAAARALAGVLGRQAAREFFAKATGMQRVL